MKRFTLLFLMIPLMVQGAYLSKLPTQVTDPGGVTHHLWASGDEYANRLHDENGFTVIQSPTDGYYYYAVLENSEPVPSAHRFGSVDPASLGLAPNINISEGAYKKKKMDMQVPMRGDGRGPNTGVVNNLNVFIRFSDQTEFEDSRAIYDARFNPVGEDAYSLRSYFHHVSYNQLDYVTHHYPICAEDENLSYQDSHPRSYFMPYNAITNPGGYQDSWERAAREQTMLADAIAYIEDQVPAELNLDADNDGNVDNVCFIIRGPHTAWSDLLWAHRWSLYYADADIHGKQVWDFTFQPENQNNVNVLCHEMFHSVGAPDLYHYTYNGVTPAGPWDIMESGMGHMGMYMKRKYGGWISTIPAISQPGSYTLNPVTSATNNAYRININGSNNEYFILEYRKQNSDAYEAFLPGSGLLIYRIKSNLDGNADGPPDEVYIFRPNGSLNDNGQIADAAFSLENFRTSFNRYTNPASALSSGTAVDLNIHSIGSCLDSITFSLGSSDMDFPPVFSEIYPPDWSFFSTGDIEVRAAMTVNNSTITSVDFFLDDQLLASDPTPPYGTLINSGQLLPGHYEIISVAHAANGLSTAERSRIRIFDPLQQNWFSWLSHNPWYDSYGRGAVPIQVALELDLGAEEYELKKLRWYLKDDPWGDPSVPGEINLKIVRFGDSAITDEILYDGGNIISELDQWFEYEIFEEIILQGKIAIVLDLFEYQNIVFDLNAPCGHSWLTEPNRPWTDALGRGIQGSAAIEVLLQTPGMAQEDPLLPCPQFILKNYPNPFNPNTTIEFVLPQRSETELTIYNLRGQKVTTLGKGILEAGSHRLYWDGTDNAGNPAPSGIYFYQLKTNSQRLVRKMLMAK
ncbi:MAG: M6 family metalloprotease domain-containing protein [Candidatus Cloacimonetes bacterium]|nr:M6 family metalloprotease domain-containing protein [Candidatus Cloacimonadota bacterium]